jgi:hypothetical protein
MKVQVIQNTRGKPTGVFIPIGDWKELKKRFKGLAVLEYQEPDKDQLLLELKEAIVELGLIEQGKLKSRPANELLNEL